MHDHPPCRRVVEGCAYCKEHGNIFLETSAKEPDASLPEVGAIVNVRLMPGSYEVLTTCAKTGRFLAKSCLDGKFIYTFLLSELDSPSGRDVLAREVEQQADTGSR